MDRMDDKVGRMPGSQSLPDQPAESRTRARPRPALWTGSGMDRNCADFVPVMWDGSCLD
jgi:hypothetical protein